MVVNALLPFHLQRPNKADQWQPGESFGHRSSGIQARRALNGAIVDRSRPKARYGATRARVRIRSARSAVARGEPRW